MTEDGTPDGWAVDQNRRYTPADRDRELAYVTYRHETGDLRVRVAPLSLDGDDRPGYAITTTTYPGLEFSERERVRTALRFEASRDLARRFMVLFETRYDGPADFEDALEYATERVRASEARDVSVDGYLE